MPRRLLFVALLAIACRSADTRDAVADARDAESAQRFVQAFYDWYVPLGERLAASRADSVVIGRASYFVPLLQHALRDDLAAQRDASEIVSVLGDYDPFLMTQDPCTYYEARTAIARPSSVEVAVYARCAGDSTAVAVLVDVVRDGNTWRFADFRRPDAPMMRLIDALRAAQAERDTSASAEHITVRPLRDVPVMRGGAVQEQRGVLYGDTAMVLPRGTMLISTPDVGEGSCRVYAGALRIALSSCPWLPGFRDHQSEIFAVELR